MLLPAAELDPIHRIVGHVHVRVPDQVAGGAESSYNRGLVSSKVETVPPSVPDLHRQRLLAAEVPG